MLGLCVIVTGKIFRRACGCKPQPVCGIELRVPEPADSDAIILAIPIACIAWTFTHEAVLREFQEFCKVRSNTGGWFRRKLFYLFTCEYCLSHYVTALFLVITRFKLVFPDWRGYVISLFSLVWVANQYISIYDRLRLDIKREHISINTQQQQVKSIEEQPKRVA